MPETIHKVLSTGDSIEIILMTLVILVCLLLIGWVALALRLRRVGRQINALNRGIDGQNLFEVLTTHLDTVDATVRRMDALEQAVGVLQAQVPGCLQSFHMVRYNAFEDVGGEQSFAIALLNGKGDGVLLTSVCSRQEVRIYSKSIQNGQASHPLSHEEERVLREINGR